MVHLSLGKENVTYFHRFCSPTNEENSMFNDMFETEFSVMEWLSKYQFEEQLM